MVPFASVALGQLGNLPRGRKARGAWKDSSRPSCQATEGSWGGSGKWPPAGKEVGRGYGLQGSFQGLGRFPWSLVGCLGTGLGKGSQLLSLKPLPSSCGPRGRSRAQISGSHVGCSVLSERRKEMPGSVPPNNIRPDCYRHFTPRFKTSVPSKVGIGLAVARDGRRQGRRAGNHLASSSSLPPECDQGMAGQSRAGVRLEPTCSPVWTQSFPGGWGISHM